MSAGYPRAERLRKSTTIVLVLRRNPDRMPAQRAMLSTNPSTRAQASRHASACSVIVLSKKECGAPG
jgi:hypothetical protein